MQNNHRCARLDNPNNCPEKQIAKRSKKQFNIATICILVLWVFYSVTIASFMVSCSGVSTSCRFSSIPKSRVIILTDMLNESDDSQTMVHLLMNTNKMDIEGLIAVSSCHQYAGKNDSIFVRNGVHPEAIKNMVNAYGKVRNNLMLHESGWPTTGYLLGKIGSGPSGYGMSAVGDEKTTTGSALIADAILSSDPRPLYICINAGANCLAQTLFDLKKSVEPAMFDKLISHIRVYDDAGQDDAGAWIAKNFPAIRYQRSQSMVFSYMSDMGPVTWDTNYYAGKAQHLWASKNIQNDHGPLGEMYPDRMKWKSTTEFNTLEGGGTSTWIGHVNRGLYVPEEMTWGGWGGRFDSTKKLNILAEQLKWANLVASEEPYKPFYMFPEASDRWIDPETGITYHDSGTPIYRWRRAYQNDFEARMNWCVQPYNGANHNPIAAINKNITDDIVFCSVNAGESVVFNSSASVDPDHDTLKFRWFIYPEAGNYSGTISIPHPEEDKVKIKIPIDAKGKQIHLILEVRDSGLPQLYDYRRIVINAE